MASDGSLKFDTKVDTSGMDKGVKSLKSQAMSLAQEYKKAGMAQSDAMKKAWSEIERNSEKSADEVKKDWKNLKLDINTDTIKSKLSSLAKVAGTATKAIAVGVAGATTALGGLAVASVKLASDLTEVQNVVDTTFGSNATQINDWAKSADTAFGLSELQAKKMNGTMGAMLKSMGLTEQQTLDMSESMTGLAGDFASFYNLDSQEAFDKIRSGISGETEPLKQLGINMSVANLEAYALSEGITKSYNSMTQAEQATLRYNYLMSVSADAQGDFAKTSGSLANQMRIAQLQVQSLGASVGEMLMPMAGEGLKVLNGFATQLNDAFKADGLNGLIGELGDVLAQAITKITEYAPQMISAGIGLINSLLNGIQQNLPQIVNGAMETITAFISGMLDMLPQILQMGIDLIIQLALGIAEQLPQLIPTAINTILTLVETILDNIDMLVDTAIELILALAEGLINALPILIEKAPEIVIKLVNALVENAPKILTIGIKLISVLVEGILNALPTLIANVPKIITAIVTTMTAGFRFIVNIGENIVEGLWEGIINAKDWLQTKLKTWCGDIITAIKGWFGIHSPSRIMRDEVGSMIAEGVAIGIEDSANLAINATEDMAVGIISAMEQYNKEYERINAEREKADEEKADAEYQNKIKNAKNAEELEKIKQERVLEIQKQSNDDYLAQLKEKATQEEKARDKEFSKLKTALSLRYITENEYYTILASLRDRYFEKGSEEWENYTVEIAKHNQELQNDLIAQQEKTIDKLSDFDNLYTKKTTTYKGFGSEFVISETILTDWEQKSKEIEEYTNALTELQEKGVADGILENIRSKSVDEGLADAKALLGLSDEALTNYIADYNKFIETAQKSGKILSPLSEGVAENSDSAILEMKTKLEEFYGEVPDGFFDLGTNSADAFGSSFITRITEWMKQAQAIINETLASMTPVLSAAGMGTASNSYSATYNLYGSGETVSQQLQSAKAAATVEKLRGGY